MFGKPTTTELYNATTRVLMSMIKSRATGACSQRHVDPNGAFNETPRILLRRHLERFETPDPTNVALTAQSVAPQGANGVVQIIH